MRLLRLRSGLRAAVMGGGKPVTPWYLSGGIAKANVASVYRAEGAASQAAALVNLANPGTNNLSAVGTAPTWDAINGFAYGGSNAHETGIVPSSDLNFSGIVKFSNNVPSNNDAPFGAHTASNSALILYCAAGSPAKVAYWQGNGARYTSGANAAGVLGISGGWGYYKYGNRDATLTMGTFGQALARSIYLGGCHSSSLVESFVGNIQAALFAKTTALTAFQMACLTLALEDYSYVNPTLKQTVIQAADFFEDGYSVDRTNYIETNCYAYVKFTTTTRILGISIYFSGTALSANYNIGVWVDGSPYATINPSVTKTAETVYIVLPSGSKSVQITTGMFSYSSGKPVGGPHPISVWTEDDITFDTPTSSNRMVIYGDSIAVGDRALRPPCEGWAMLLRAARGNVMVEGWGFRGLKTDCDTAEHRAAFVSRLAGYSPAEIWMAIGTNDYGLELWSAADFGTAYAALLDDLHTALPSAHIYCQCPIPRTNETANSFGNTLGDYRTQISTAVSTRTDWCEYVDASTWTIARDEGVHPTTAGHAQYEAYVETVLGL